MDARILSLMRILHSNEDIRTSFFKYSWEWYKQIVMILFRYLWAVRWDERGYKCIYCLENFKYFKCLVRWDKRGAINAFIAWKTCTGASGQRHVEAKTHFMAFCKIFFATDAFWSNSISLILQNDLVFFNFICIDFLARDMSRSEPILWLFATTFIRNTALTADICKIYPQE